ncbi:MAG TPA: 4'-phosphopantetheinyl transferase, partial [Terriglobia bacterium]|nr:4'-phosphopantetheinyl transferase [Terriglobia bacterium]
MEYKGQGGLLMIDIKLASVVWAVAPTKPDLLGEEVHIWRASLNLEPDVLKRLEATLAPEEKSRAARFIMDRDRDSFIAARGILRELLGKYLGWPPATLEFDYGPHGKPALHTENSHPPICFNLSHSHGLALYAFADRRELGIDLELIRPDFGGEEVAKRFFSTRELTELRALPPALQ